MIQLITYSTWSVVIFSFAGIQRIRSLNLKLIAIVNTHGHVDHICGIGEVIKEWDVPIYLHPKDQPLYEALPDQARWFGLDYPPAPAVGRPLYEDQEIEVGELQVKIYHTPGHSPGSLTYVFDEFAVVGDTLFNNGIGRTDLYRGDYETLVDSIKDNLEQLYEYLKTDKPLNEMIIDMINAEWNF